MDPWLITFRSPAEAANVARAMRALLFDPNITGPDPDLPTLKYFAETLDETLKDVEQLFSFVAAYGLPIKITPPSDYQERLRESKVVRSKFDLSLIWPSGLFSDLTLLVGDEEFKVHRAILASASDYFAALLTRMKETGQSTIRLEETDPEVFQKLLNLIYGSLPTHDPLLLEVLILAQRYQIKGLNYEDAITSIPDFEPEDHPILIQLLDRIYPERYPKAIVELLDLLDVDLGLLRPEVADEIQRERISEETRYRQLPDIRARRAATLNLWIPPTQPLATQ